MADSTDTAPAPPTNGQKVYLPAAAAPRPMTAAPPRPVAPAKVEHHGPKSNRDDPPPVEKLAAKPAGPAAAGQFGVHVCPFCGAKRADPADACPKCTMRDTPATRAATAERLGPWFVLQSRSPSAPGMRLDTLRLLAKKGHVSRRSVLRGPTTGQFWTFAERARGVAREFGVCHSCGADVKPTADRCPRCAADQRPPADPDLLLVGPEPANGREKAEARAAPALPSTPKPPAQPPARRPPSKISLAKSAGASGSGGGGEGIFSAKELAAAFKLDHDRSVDPDNPTPRPKRKPRRWGLMLLLTILVLAAAVAGLYFYPPTHDEVVVRFERVRAWIAEHGPTIDY